MPELTLLTSYYLGGMGNSLSYIVFDKNTRTRRYKISLPVAFMNLFKEVKRTKDEPNN